MLKIKHFIIVLWISIVLTGLTVILIYPDLLTPTAIAAKLVEFKEYALAVYLFLSLARGLTLIPSTPLVIAGTILFPLDPFLVLTISLIGILGSSTMIYFFSEYLGIGEIVGRKRPEQIERIRWRLQSPAGFVFVFLWSFLPLVPTDAVCYVAGSLRMHFGKFLTAIFLGELILCSIYVFSLNGLLRMISSSF